MKYIILGESGSYSDYRAWPLACAETKEKAENCLSFIKQQILDFQADASLIVKEENANRDARPFLNIPEHPKYPYPHQGGFTWDSPEHKAALAIYEQEQKQWGELYKVATDTDEWRAWEACLSATSDKRKTLEEKYQKLLFNDTVDILYLHDVSFRIVEVRDTDEYMSVSHCEPTPQCECH